MIPKGYAKMKSKVPGRHPLSYLQEAKKVVRNRLFVYRQVGIDLNSKQRFLTPFLLLSFDTEESGIDRRLSFRRPRLRDQNW
jgi:hypothetical protein